MTYRSVLKSTALAALFSTASAFSAQAVYFHTTDGSIDGSLCVGFDCLSAETFGFDTLRLKENNLRMHFDDTSTAASFPDNDWRLTANDSANGGAEHFSIEDASAGRFVFRVFAGARSNALVVDSQGDLGLGTSTPAVDIDIKTGDTPTVRLQQDGTAGFTPQTWDLAGNETNFFVRDVTGGSALPFRIRPGADSNSIFIDTDNDVAMGNASPDANLHIDRTHDNANLHVEDTDGRAQIWLEEPTNSTSELKLELANDLFEISFNGTGAAELRIDRVSGNVTLPRGGLITQDGGGACTVADPCDAVFDPDVYTVPSIEEHAALMWENKHLPAVGPTGPGIPINVTEKMVRMLNELEHAHIYIEQLHHRIEALEEALIDKKG